jgi:hypothetical protein
LAPIAVVRFPIDRSNDRGQIQNQAAFWCHPNSCRTIGDSPHQLSGSSKDIAIALVALWHGVSISWPLILLRLGGSPLQVSELGVTYPLIHRYAQG